MSRLAVILFMAAAACWGQDDPYDFAQVQHWKYKDDHIFLVEIPDDAKETEMSDYADSKGDRKSGYTAVYFYLKGSNIPGISARYRWDYTKVSEWIHSGAFDRYSYRYVRSPNAGVSFDIVDPLNFQN